MNSIDDLLNQLKTEYEQPTQPQVLKKPNVLGFSLEELSVGEQKQPNFTPIKNYTVSPDDIILSQLKAEFEEQEQAERLQKEQQLQAEKRRQEQIRQQQREAFTKQAEAWLKNLDPLSSEGLWFEQFAIAYDSKIAAAVDYLEALGNPKQ